MRLGLRNWLFIITVTITCCVCLMAGVWQINRAEEKKQLIQRTMAYLTVNNPKKINRSLLNAGSVRISLSGKFKTDSITFLDNRIRNGRAGYDVFCLFYPDQLDLVFLVNLGWITAPMFREKLPTVILPEQTVLLTGLWIRLPESISMGEPNLENIGTFKRVQFLDPIELFPRITTVLPGAVVSDPLIKNLSPAEISKPRLGPEGHYGYAVQWFLMAIALFIALLVWLFRGMGR